MKDFDLVAVEHGCFLEPNYVIVDCIPIEFEPFKVRDANNLTPEQVKVYKYFLRGQET